MTEYKDNGSRPFNGLKSGTWMKTRDGRLALLGYTIDNFMGFGGNFLYMCRIWGSESEHEYFADGQSIVSDNGNLDIVGVWDDKSVFTEDGLIKDSFIKELNNKYLR